MDIHSWHRDKGMIDKWIRVELNLFDKRMKHMHRWSIPLHYSRREVHVGPLLCRQIGEYIHVQHSHTLVV